MALSGLSSATHSIFVTSPSGSVALWGVALVRCVARAFSPSRHMTSCLLKWNVLSGSIGSNWNLLYQIQLLRANHRSGSANPTNIP